MKVDEITKKLEDGVKNVFESGNYAEYLKVMSNMSKFHNYSVYNCILIAMQKPEATMVAGYKKWQKEFNRQVKKGEKSIKIIAPLPHKKLVEKDGEEKEVSWISYRAVPVFDISQTEGQEIPTLCHELKGTVEEYTTIIAKLENISEVPVVYDDIKGPAKGYYSDAEKMITICKGMEEKQTVKTLVHELTHSILHRKELATDTDRRTREVQAESVAYVVCDYLGIDTSDYSFEYIASWSSNKETKELKASLDIIQETAKKIIAAL